MAMLLRPALLWPDRSTWHADPAYSSTVARALRSGFSHIAAADAPRDNFLWACAEVAPCMNSTMAIPQRVRVFLLFARTLEVEGVYTDALSYVDRALDVAAHDPTSDDFTDLLLYHAKLERARGRYLIAASDLAACLGLLRNRAHGDEALIDPALHLEILAQLADYEFFLGHLPAAARLVSQAQRLAPSAPHRRLDAASIAWVQAHLDRLRGRAWESVQPMLRVESIYAHEAPPISRGRLAYFVAELALDVAARRADGPLAAYRAEFLRLARVHLDSAERLAHEANDRGGRGLVQLARVRYSRLYGGNSNRSARIVDVLRLARRLDDDALLAQAFTALGDELAYQGEHERALDCYRQTIGLMDGSDFPVLALPARRRLLLAREMAGAADPQQLA
jgi:tetratricopeptide (TPR) repeat protein